MGHDIVTFPEDLVSLGGFVLFELLIIYYVLLLFMYC
jgi:hypothetical protein